MVEKQATANTDCGFSSCHMGTCRSRLGVCVAQPITAQASPPKEQTMFYSDMIYDIIRVHIKVIEGTTLCSDSRLR